ncbi:hypothetical protein [Streptomyces naphthomycinicus]|uniref:hypothetical protein n=1 Tax=Streptomyces naphthomycinicus TaxID=2872625 RepID=UPI001CED7767|nr:hypothetical protein [Streptomyces sp. TML10]
MSTHPTDGPIHEWFSLSYSNHLVLPRTLLQSMPIEFQERMVACLTELHAAFEHVPQAEVYEVHAATEHIISEMGSDLLEEAGITEDWYDEPVPEDLSPFDLAEWKAEHEKGEPTYYDRDGNEVDPHSRVLLPAPDPVPHYNRGRTYIQPRSAGPDPCSGCRYATCASCRVAAPSDL